MSETTEAFADTIQPRAAAVTFDFVAPQADAPAFKAARPSAPSNGLS